MGAAAFICDIVVIAINVIIYLAIIILVIVLVAKSADGIHSIVDKISSFWNSISSPHVENPTVFIG